MSDDLDFEMEVVKTEETDLSSSPSASNSEESDSPRVQETEPSELISGVLWSKVQSIPDGWDLLNLGPKVSIQTGFNASSKNFVEEGGIPLIRNRDLGTSETEIQYDGDFGEEYLIEPGDLLVSMDGEFEPHRWTGGRALLNQRVCKVEGSEGLNNVFLSYALEKPLYLLQKSIAGTTVKHLSKSDIRSVNLPTPPLPEQRKIASVLYAVDQAIRKTEEIIEQARMSREGLATKLFTEGCLDHEIRESTDWRCRAKQFPVSWNVDSASSVMKITRGASPRPRSDDSLFGGEIPWIKIGDADHGESQSIDSVESFVTEKGKKKSKYVESGTLLVANSGATCGFTIFAGVSGCVHDGWLILRDYDDFDPKYLYHYINWNYGFLRSLSLGSAQTNLNTQLFGRLDIPRPPLEEQQEIADSLDSFQNYAHSLEGEKRQLESLKRGLMQDLLTGEVRTVDKAIEVLDEVAAHG